MGSCFEYRTVKIITQQSIVDVPKENFLQTIYDKAIGENASLLFIIDTICPYNNNHLLIQLLEQDNYYNISNLDTFNNIIDLNSPLEQNIILQFNAELQFLHYASDTTIYIAFCNKLLGGDIEKTISNAFDIITKENIKRLLIHDSRYKSNVAQIKNLFEKHLANSATYNIELTFSSN